LRDAMQGNKGNGGTSGGGDHETVDNAIEGAGVLVESNGKAGGS